MELLNLIQQKLKAPKNQKNTFGNYNYRSCEDILEAVKPHLGAGVLTLSDEIVLIGDRFYIKATARLVEGSGSIGVAVTAYARESLDKKGMDSSQITGAASSYARKYALNGLFLIDDTKDADSEGPQKERMTPYKMERRLPPADDEAGGAMIREEVPDEKQFMEKGEIEELQKEKIRKFLKMLGKKPTQSAVMDATGIKMIPENYQAIIDDLEEQIKVKSL